MTNELSDKGVFIEDPDEIIEATQRINTVVMNANTEKQEMEKTKKKKVIPEEVKVNE